MKIFRLRNFTEYLRHQQRNLTRYLSIRKYESGINLLKEKKFTVQGVSYTSGQIVDFQVDYLYSDGENINWRERIVCPITQLNNRLRCSVHLFDLEGSPYPDSRIYITEQVTPLYSFLKSKYPHLIGSEYLGDNIQPGTIINDIRHEDMTNLSFLDSSFEYYLSFECFEHIPFYEKAISEIYRVLQPGGMFLGSFPFDLNSSKNIIRATINPDGTINHLLEPEYHGDPVSEKGILCFTVFGWELLDQFRNAGFKDVYLVLAWSDLFGYLGGEQVFFIAKK